MEGINNFEKTQAGEKSNRINQQEKLNNITGFLRLTLKQKQYIELSLYIQQRAERKTDLISASRVQQMPEKFAVFAQGKPYIAHSDVSVDATSADARRYLSSQSVIMNHYCHQAIKKLESYAETHHGVSEWTDAGPISTYAELEELIELSKSNGQLPFVVEVWDGAPEQGSSSRVHSALLLGSGQGREMVVWEKTGFHMPYQLVSLEQLYATYSGYKGWRLRSLEV